jgi:hypothetical protein
VRERRAWDVWLSRHGWGRIIHRAVPFTTGVVCPRGVGEESHCR